MGRLEAICITSAASQPMEAVSEIEALVGIGLAGDRYANGVGFYSPRPTDPGAREVTLIAAETLDELQLSPTQHRRNLTVRGVNLSELLGERFTIGEVVLEGVKDCPPCEHLEQLARKALIRPLLERGGLRARIVVGGTLRVGDAIVVAAPAKVQL